MTEYISNERIEEIADEYFKEHRGQDTAQQD